jgi:hypothetical protein
MLKTLGMTPPLIRKEDGYTPEQNLTDWRKKYFIPSLAMDHHSCSFQPGQFTE